MIREGQDVDAKTQTMGNTPLHIAARNGHYLIVKYLLEKMANPSILNNNMLTPKQLMQEVLIQDQAKVEQLAKK